MHTFHLDRRAASLAAVEAPDDYLLTSDELASWLGVAPITIKRWRRVGEGPTYARAGLRAVRYKKGDVLAWLSSRAVTTAKAGPDQ